jgi:hypothetical protein
MATLTVSVEAKLIETLKSEAERRGTTLDELVVEKLAGVSPVPPPQKRDHSALLRLMERAPLGDFGTPLSREEIYAERTWPRS